GSGDVLFLTCLAPYKKLKFLGSGGSIVARLKLKEINGRALLGVNVTVYRSSSALERSQ
ncbi:hypothetical protein P153DRAFT_304447, partial [Dothidotthia symphoricarpi CBS 119687]